MVVLGNLSNHPEYIHRNNRDHQIARDKKSNEKLDYRTALQIIGLGNYIDCGACQLETLCFLLVLKCCMPRRVTLLRGKHEWLKMNETFGFSDELMERLGPTFGVDKTIELWHKFNSMFGYMPVAAKVDAVLCAHGGISPKLKTAEDILKIERPISLIQDDMLVRDLIWAEPVKNAAKFTKPTFGYNNQKEQTHKQTFWKNTKSGVSYQFSPEVLQATLQNVQTVLLVRGGMGNMNGYEIGPKYVSICTAPAIKSRKLPAPTDADPNAIHVAKSKAAILVLQKAASDVSASCTILKVKQTGPVPTAHLLFRMFDKSPPSNLPPSGANEMEFSDGRRIDLNKWFQQENLIIETFNFHS